MARFQNDSMLDAGLNWVIDNTRARWATSGAVVTYASAVTLKLASTTYSSADFTLAAGDTDGRKITCAVASGVSVTTQGSATHFALVHPASSLLTYVTLASTKLVPAGSQVTFGAFDITLRDATAP